MRVKEIVCFFLKGIIKSKTVVDLCFVPDLFLLIEGKETVIAWTEIFLELETSDLGKN